MLAAVALAAKPLPAVADEFDRAASELLDKYAKELDQLAAWCDSQGLADQAGSTRAWLSPRNPDKLYVAVFPREVGRSEPVAGTPPGLVEWDKRFHQLRREQANSLEALARRAVRNGRASLAFDLVLAALRENPDHEAIRGLLGYQKHQNEWRTVWEISKLRSGQVHHETFGWIPKAHVRRYEQGQRYSNGRWITAEEDAQLHRDIRSGWDVETEHYTVRTNHSLEAGVQLGAKLERLYRVWKQLFVRYFAAEDQVTALFDGRARSNWARLPRHQVVYFRTRDDYNQALRAAFPNIEMSIGVYVDSTRRAYFFAGESYDDRTLYHEATHQLFHESRPVAPDVGLRANFWIVEGIALYMESLHEEHGFHVLGGFDDLRMLAARYRLLHDDFYVPLADLTAMGREALQSHPQIATVYSQAAGLTHFLICHDGGRYRDALVAYLGAVYSGRDKPGALAELVAASYADLDRQYREFIQSAGMPTLAEEK
ncbi:MAG: hypothetical protein HUU20_28940 [Pirellulales bacterium]|nr:hypothetical protein [Pirellulales bacterium]